MKKLFAISVLILAAVIVTACAPAPKLTQGLAQMPEEGQKLISWLVTAGVTWLLLQASIFFKVELGGYVNAVAVAISPIIVAIFEYWLNFIPQIYDNVVLTVIHLIVLLVGSIGTWFLFQRNAPKLR